MSTAANDEMSLAEYLASGELNLKLFSGSPTDSSIKFSNPDPKLKTLALLATMTLNSNNYIRLTLEQILKKYLP